MDWTPEGYRRAGEAHVETAQKLMRSSEATEWRAVYFLSGLAAECLLRSVTSRGEGHDREHNLGRLFDEGSLGGTVFEGRSARQVNFLLLHWRSHHRFLSPDDLARNLSSVPSFMKEKRRQKSPSLEFAARTCANAAEAILVALQK